jgi:hypothetical protein
MLIIPVFVDCDDERVFADVVTDYSGFILRFRQS